MYTFQHTLTCRLASAAGRHQEGLLQAGTAVAPRPQPSPSKCTCLVCACSRLLAECESTDHHVRHRRYRSSSIAATLCVRTEHALGAVSGPRYLCKTPAASAEAAAAADMLASVTGTSPCCLRAVSIANWAAEAMLSQAGGVLCRAGSNCEVPGAAAYLRCPQ